MVRHRQSAIAHRAGILGRHVVRVFGHRPSAREWLPVVLWVALITGPGGTATAQGRLSPSDSQLARTILKELVEINTTDSAGNTPRAARAMARRLVAAGFAPADVRVLIGPDPRHGNLVARYRGSGAGGRP